MKDPDSLKLNKQLNEFLGGFIMYHIYLGNLVRLVILSGFFGISFVISALLDVLKLLTIHNYCIFLCTKVKWI